MAESNLIKVFLAHNNQRHAVVIGSDKTIGDLMEIIEGLTDIPVTNMKVICSGKTVSNIPAQKVKDSGLKEGSKIMILGKKVNAAEDAILEKLKPIRLEFQNKLEKLNRAEETVINYEKGFVQETKVVDKEIMLISENFMKTLEKLDSFSIGQDFKAARERRKNLVRDIQESLDRTDVMRSRLSFNPTGKGSGKLR